MAKCKSCGAEIVWIKTTAGKNMPCDAKPVPFTYRLGAKDKVVTKNGEVLPADISPDEPEEMGYIPHWATCPRADKHRRGR